MRIHLVLCGLFAVAIASPAFAQSASTPQTGTGNYNLSGSYGGKSSGISILGNSTMPGMGVGGSSLGNGNLGTSYGRDSLNAGSGISVDGSGFSDGMSALPSVGGPTTAVPGHTGRTHPMR
jgi:hypothetical protein